MEKNSFKIVIVCTFSSFIYHQMMGVDDMILVFWILSFKPAFSLSSFILIVAISYRPGPGDWSQ